MQGEFSIFVLVALVMSIVLHEVSHGYVANMLGDPTAKLQGRLTLNPISHVDLLGTILVPGILLLSNASFLIGWAKPVPYNPYNLRDQKYGEAKVAAAGPLMNLLIAIVFALFMRAGVAFDFISMAAYQLALSIVVINVLLAFFNMLPIPPLDGSKMLPVILPRGLRYQYEMVLRWFNQIGFIASIAILYVAVLLIWPIFFGPLINTVIIFLVG